MTAAVRPETDTWFLTVQYVDIGRRYTVREGAAIFNLLEGLLLAGLYASSDEVWRPAQFGRIDERRRAAKEMDGLAMRAFRELEIYRVSYSSPWYMILQAPGIIAGAAGSAFAAVRGLLHLFKKYDDVRMNHNVTNLKVELVRRLKEDLPNTGTKFGPDGSIYARGSVEQIVEALARIDTLTVSDTPPTSGREAARTDS